MTTRSSILSTPIVYLKGVGPLRAELLQKELGVFTFQDLVLHYPFRHVDKTKITLIGNATQQEEYAQFAGVLSSFEVIGNGRTKRLIATLRDASGVLELAWFQSIALMQKILVPGAAYLVYGRLGFFMGKPQLVHPEIEMFAPEKTEAKEYLEPIYPTTEKLKAKNLGGRQLGKLTQVIIQAISENDIPENIPDTVRSELKLINRIDAIKWIHFPRNHQEYHEALRRLKFEEIFMPQLRLQMRRSNRHRYSRGVVFSKVGNLFNHFYNQLLPFELTGAQKRVLKEIRNDTTKGRQMNRLVQGDVGSGKTIVALLSMLLAADNGFQSVLMAPTEILARQHFETIQQLLSPLSIQVQLLTGSIKGKARKNILEEVKEGIVSILIGTHAVIEDAVQFKNLGLVIVDEQHRFGVAQRAKLWDKASILPHVMVMTATPIPRTLAMTAYGDLDYSVIDELPPGRKPIVTVHRFSNDRSLTMDFIKSEIALGRQIYIIFPLIEESEKLDYENLMQGYDEIKTYFPEPQYWISMVHGKMKAAQKDENMRRFVEKETQIMVATTVIEVGVNVPNASVMMIESAEKFGLSQLHQLRGRVGRGAEKSYCILLTGKQLGKEARERMKIMTSTSNGFLIAEKDLELRGPGDIEGTRQSGDLNFKLANIINDRAIVEVAKQVAEKLLIQDPDLSLPENNNLKLYLQSQKGKTGWSKIS
ncbi:MAG: ATP-dependent DNA helicase RecG [Chitinophagaceae bacterium]|nr:MAG: ATP-dependent DNA helicase RecG [Chitinophagaceae bacterium]